MAGKRLTRAESREVTKARLLDAAAGLFAEHGVNGTSVERIAERAGYTRGAFYANFEDKGELVAALSGRRLEGVEGFLLRTELTLYALRNPGRAERTVRELLEGLVRDATEVLERPTDPRTPPSASPSG
ncbi:TetR/AcrR family transcriptional regulator [Amycolatopsis sp. NPDC088138]|uniref:TetR/AcrR family transcriptional regulator n=1 Tax=Amycolatopsis sp. NPDC088138 TaxID=3363938 RepID=UPI0037F334FC